MSQPSAVMALRAVRKRYGRRAPWVLDGIDVESRRGSVTAVTGVNGSGKSTLLRIAAALTLPTSGHVENGFTSTGYAGDRLPARIRMTARAYLGHMARMRGLSGTARVETLLERLPVHPGPDEPMRSLSKGNVQKVMIVQALLAAPGLLLLDEPFSGLDARSREAVDDLLHEHAGAGSAIVIAAHESRLPRADTVVALADGRLRGRTHTTADTQTVTVVLRGVGHDDGLDALPGVVTVTTNADHVTVTVSRACSDMLLTKVLRRGWSVDSVGPTS